MVILHSHHTGSTGIQGGRYKYTGDLLALERVSVESEPETPGRATVAVSGFLPLQEWSPYLRSHPDADFADFMRRGLSQGFRIGFNYRHPLRPAPGNFRSVNDNPRTVNQYISNEVAAGRLVASTSPATRRNTIGIIPKPHQPGKFRLIVDLSAPQGNSVNDGIHLQLCSLEYVTVDQAARRVARYGRGALVAKTDLQAAYRYVPVHPRDQHLIGLEWGGRTYQDRALPFGLRSVPKLFTAVGDCLTWHCCVRVSMTVSTTWTISCFRVLPPRPHVSWPWEKPWPCVTGKAFQLLQPKRWVHPQSSHSWVLK